VRLPTVVANIAFTLIDPCNAPRHMSMEPLVVHVAESDFAIGAVRRRTELRICVEVIVRASQIRNCFRDDRAVEVSAAFNLHICVRCVDGDVGFRSSRKFDRAGARVVDQEVVGDVAQVGDGSPDKSKGLLVPCPPMLIATAPSGLMTRVALPARLKLLML
jgi:hypothetical protein